MIRSLKLVQIAVGVASSAVFVAPAISQVVERDGQPSVVFLADGDEAMNEAIVQARQSLPLFFETLEGSAAESAEASNFMLKVALPTTEGGTEHIWVTDIDVSEDGSIEAALGNVPLDLVCCTRLGERVEFDEGMISDWAYAYAGRFRGHFTTRVLVSDLTPEEGAAVLAVLHVDPLPPKE